MPVTDPSAPMTDEQRQAAESASESGEILPPASHQTLVEKIMADLRHPSNLDITTRVAVLETAVHGLGTAILGLFPKPGAE